MIQSCAIYRDNLSKTIFAHFESQVLAKLSLYKKTHHHKHNIWANTFTSIIALTWVQYISLHCGTCVTIIWAKEFSVKKKNKTFTTGAMLTWSDVTIIEVCNKDGERLFPKKHPKKTPISLSDKQRENLTLHYSYRGISLNQVASKVYTRLLLNRGKSLMDNLLHLNQNGGISNRRELLLLFS